MLTGESRPVGKGRGRRGDGRRHQRHGAFTLRVEKTGADTYLSQVVDMVRQAQESRARAARLANRAAGWLTYAAVGIGTVTLVFWLAARRGVPVRPGAHGDGDGDHLSARTGSCRAVGGGGVDQPGGQGRPPDPRPPGIRAGPQPGRRDLRQDRHPDRGAVRRQRRGRPRGPVGRRRAGAGRDAGEPVRAPDRRRHRPRRPRPRPGGRPAEGVRNPEGPRGEGRDRRPDGEGGKPRAPFGAGPRPPRRPDRRPAGEAGKTVVFVLDEDRLVGAIRAVRHRPRRVAPGGRRPQGDGRALHHADRRRPGGRDVGGKGAGARRGVRRRCCPTEGGQGPRGQRAGRIVAMVRRRPSTTRRRCWKPILGIAIGAGTERGGGIRRHRPGPRRSPRRGVDPRPVARDLAQDDRELHPGDGLQTWSRSRWRPAVAFAWGHLLSTGRRRRAGCRPAR